MPPLDPIAAQLSAKFEIIRRVGVGGMAEVYEAVQRGAQGFHRRIALKVLLPDLQDDREVVDMFIDEAMIMSRLEHPNIVSVLDFGEADGSYYLALEYVDGVTLAGALRAARRAFPIPAAALCVRDLCRALHYIHTRDQQIVHRDVTPHNIFISVQGQIKLGDFGIAKTAARRSRTEAGKIKGKLSYLAPEQVTGEPVTSRTDIYAAGLILFELLTGRRLLQGDDEVQLLRAASAPPQVRPSSERPDAAPLDAIVGRALQRAPTLRYPSASAMATGLDRCISGGVAIATRQLEQLATKGEDTSGDRASATRIDRPERGFARPGRQPPSGSDPLATQTPRTAAVARPATRVARPPSSPTITRAPPEVRSGRTRVIAALSGSLVLLGGVAFALYARWEPRAAISASDGAVQPVRADVRREGQVVAAVAASDSGADLAPNRASARDGPVRPHGEPVARSKRRRRHRGKRHRRRRRTRRDKRRPRRAAARPGPPGGARGGGTSGDPPGAVTPAGHPKAPARSQLRAQLDRAIARGRTGGIYPGDHAGLRRLVSRARALVRSGPARKAEAAISNVESFVARFKVDRAFAEGKLARLNRAIARAELSAPQKRGIERSCQSVLKMIIARRYVEASRKISGVLARVRAASR